MAERMDEMSTYQNVLASTGIADRLALFIANETMRKLYWSHKPEILLESLKLELETRFANARNYLAEYPLFNDRERSYKIEVSLHKSGDPQSKNRWDMGHIRAEHLSGGWVFQAIVVIHWSDEGIPDVQISEFKCTEPKN